ncbi:hypothetical protein IPU75_19935 [Ochrobactrum sp. SD129]|nr:hypothetical protein [Ochrobactrum sp. SD129]
MSAIFYRIDSIENIKSGSDLEPRTFILLSRIDDNDRFTSIRIETEENKYEIGDIVTVDVTLQHSFEKAEKVSNLTFLHHFNRKNQGDILSGPYNYFKFKSYEKLSWDGDILSKGTADLSFPRDLILGGGIYFTRDKPRLVQLLKNVRKFVGWGIGLDYRILSDGFTDRYTLLGTRERKLDIIDNERVFYVPCSSCMNKVFNSSPRTKSGKVALHINGGFNSKELYEKFPDINATTTVDDFETIIDNIRDAEFVITNSYHGAYWGSLLQKKVICIKTDVPKWSGLDERIQFSSVEDAMSVMRDTDNVPPEYYKECKTINVEFYSRVVSHLAT